MAKKVHKIEAFHGGINQKNDRRDIKPEELEEAFNVDISSPGQIIMPGNATADYIHRNSLNGDVSPSDDNNILTNANSEILSGYGLFAFSHDYNMHGLLSGDASSGPQAIETEFLCINDGANIRIWDACHTNIPNTANDSWILDAIKLGQVHVKDGVKVKPVYYKADNGLRVCDGNFNQDKITTTSDSWTIYEHEVTPVDKQQFKVGDYIKVNNEIMKVIGKTVGEGDTGNEMRVERAQFGTIVAEQPAGSDVFFVNVPKVLSHIKRPMLEKARGYTSTSDFETGTGVEINTWKEDIQCLESPLEGFKQRTGESAYINRGLVVYDGKVTAMATAGVTGVEAEQHYHSPNTKEKVLFSVHESNSADDNQVVCDATQGASVTNGQGVINLIADDTTWNFSEQGFTDGKFVIITGSTNYDGLAEILGRGANAYTIQIGMEYVADDTNFTVRLEENRISEDLQNKYIFGMSYLYDGGGSEMQESRIQVGSLYNGLIEHDASIAKDVTNWDTGTDADGVTALDDTLDDSWGRDKNSFFFDDSQVGVSQRRFLIYRGSSGSIGVSRVYLISVDVTLGSAAELKIYAPGTDSGTNGTIGDGDGDGTSVTIDESGIYTFSATAASTGITDTAIFVCEGIHENDTDDTGDIRINNVQVFLDHTDGVTSRPFLMSANHAVDMRGWEGIPKMFSSFNMNNADAYKWNERISGYKIYMKQVDSASDTLSSEWLLALKVDFATGEYINYANDNVEQSLNFAATATYTDATCDTTSGSTTVSFDNSGNVDSNGAAGQPVRGSGIPSDTYISSIDTSANTLVLTNAATATADDVTLTFKGVDWSSTGTAFKDSLVCTSKKADDDNGISLMDTMRNIPLDTYQSENGYSADTNTAAMYKTATIVNRKMFIGNLKIGNKTYPDRMIEAPTDRFDTFPDDGLHYIDVAVGDGDEIVKLESVGDKLIQFKKSNAYLIEVSSEGVELIDTWAHMGIKSASQVTRAAQGIVWANNNGLYYYNGKEVQDITLDKFSSGTWEINEDEAKPTILGYDESSNKVIILTTNVSGKKHGGYIYDVASQSITECQNVFNWFPTDMSDSILEDVNYDGNIDILDIIQLGLNSDTGNIDLTSSLGASATLIDDSYLPIESEEVFRTNMVTTKDRKLIVLNSAEIQNSKANIATWSDIPRPLYNWNATAEHFRIRTQDVDFGNISRRKKIYGIYVTFKANNYMSGVVVKHGTNGANSCTGTFKDTTYYSNTKGFDSYNANAGTNDWITVRLTPSTSINNIYSFQLEFSFASAGRINQLGYNTTGVVSNESTVSETTGSVTLTVDGTAATEVLLLNGSQPKTIYKSNGDIIGECTAVNSETEIVFGNGIERDIPNDTTLYVNSVAADGTTVTFDSSASSDDDYYNGMPLYFYSGEGAGQQLRVTDYVGSTKVATITNPYNTSTNNLSEAVGTSTYFDVGHIPKEFAINDIAIIYREKSIK